MTAADEIQSVSDRVIFWQAYEPAVKADLSSCAVQTVDGLVVIDPIALKPDAMAEFTGIAPLAAIVCTNGNHARASAVYRERFGLPVFAHADAAGELGFRVDHLLSEGTPGPGGLEVITLPGGGPGEIALLAPEGSLHLGDALIHLGSTGFAMLPAKYCADAGLLRESLGKLLRKNFELMTFAHGLPVVSKARHRLATLLS